MMSPLGLAFLIYALGTQAPGDEPIVTTRHTVTIAGKALHYTARAGRIPIRDNETGEAHGQMFFVSYTLDRAPGSPPRPVTFAWNGGPGSNAALVHLIGFGPKRITPPPGARSDDESKRWVVEPNTDTWLDETDLVFVDPIGTGYSRVTKPEYDPEFYQTRGDAESVAEFIRVYRLRYDAEGAPLFLAGESFGVTRAAGVAEALERRGTKVKGVILLGFALPLGAMPEAMRTALTVPTMAVAAFTHGKLGPELQRDLDATIREATQWATTVYAPALARGASLSESERDSIVRGLSRYTGLDPSYIERKTLVVPYIQVGNYLLRREGRFVGLYDTRVTGVLDTTPGPYDPNKDPSLQHLLDPVAVRRYLRDDVGYASDLNYQGPWGGGYPPPTRFRGDWMSVKWNWVADTASDSAAGRSKTPPLEAAMSADPALRVFVACGLYDLVCDVTRNDWAVAHLDASERRNVIARSYPGGHAVYTDPRARMLLKRDVTQFIRETLAAQRTTQSNLQRTTQSAERGAVLPRRQIVVAGKPLTYSVRAGTLPIINNEDGRTRANAFYVAYTADRSPGEPPRPLTFAWNGGPGANSLLLHLDALGPRRLDSGDGIGKSRRTPSFVDNQETWLDLTDLVFVDPVGTGFSRPTDSSYAEGFYGVLEDIAATRELVRSYRARFDAWDAPVYLAGESYGTWRAAGTAEAMEKGGEHVAGVILISGGIPVGPVASDAMRAALFLPQRVATAAYHRKLPPDLQSDPARAMREAESWGRDVYAPMLQRSFPNDGAADVIVAQLSRFTGLDASRIDRRTLVVDRRFVLDMLLGDSGPALNTFDARRINGGVDDRADMTEEPRRRALVNDYLRVQLGFGTDLAYQGLESGWSPLAEPREPNASWKWDQGEPGAPLAPHNDGPPGGTPPWVQRTFALDPTTRTFVAAGIYDSLNSCPLIAYQVSQLEPALRANITINCYEGGHMIYEDRDARLRLKRDIAKFYRAR